MNPNSGINIGIRPGWLGVNLTKGADLICTLRTNTPWPTGTTLSIVLPTVTWTATISGTDAVFSVDKAVTDTIADGVTAKLTYTNGTTDQVLAIGKVARTDG